ncbi:MAG: transposase [Blautia wexlerae]
MEKDIFNIDKNKLSYGRGYVYSLQYHLVWCTKYRKKGFKKRNRYRMRRNVTESCRRI